MQLRHSLEDEYQPESFDDNLICDLEQFREENQMNSNENEESAPFRICIKLGRELQQYLNKEKTIEDKQSEVRINPLSSSDRREKINRYLEKKRRRNWNKKVIYGSRQVVASKRLRIKGRFASKVQCSPRFELKKTSSKKDILKKKTNEMYMKELVVLTSLVFELRKVERGAHMKKHKEYHTSLKKLNNLLINPN